MRSGGLLTWRERAADWLGERLGSWSFAAVVLGAGVVLSDRRDDVDGAVAVLGVVVSGLVRLDLSLPLMLVRRTDHTAAELALVYLEATARTEAELRDLGDRLDRLSVELGRLAARTRPGLDPAGGEDR